MSCSTSQPNWDDTEFINSSLFRSDISVQESQGIYKQWAQSEKYDSMISKPDVYNSLRVLGTTIRGLLDRPQDTLALDVGAGTGLTGKVLQEAGYPNIHGLEPQGDIASLAQKKGIYQKMISEFISGDPTPGVDKDTYDLVVSTGAFAPGHIPAEALIELARITKPGGYVIICMREEFLWHVKDYKEHFQPISDKLTAEGRWKQIKREIYPHHFVDRDGVLFMWQIC